MVMITKLWCRLAPLLVLLAGCQTLPTGPAQDFVTATNTLAQAESDYFDQIQAASDQSHLLFASAIYVQGGAKFADIASELNKRDDFSKAKALRMEVMAQLKNYAQQIAAITSAVSGTWIADDSKTVTTNVITLLKDQKAAKLTAQQVGLVQSAVQDLASAVINGVAAHDLQILAEQSKQPLAQIKTMIDQDTANIESDQFTPGLAADQQSAMTAMLSSVYNDPRVNSGQRLAAITAWHTWKPAQVTAGHAIAGAMNDLVKANDALAAKQTLTAGAIAQQAAALAEQALGTSGVAK
jgi:hypothetical protein